MRRIAFAMSVIAIGFAAATPARADFAVVKFKDTGACRAWYSSPTKPWGNAQVLWASEPTWDAAQAKRAYAIAHGWCKAWYY